MPFQSKAQMRAAFAGGLGPEMKAKAETWAHETPDLKHLPMHKHKKRPNEMRRDALVAHISKGK